MRDQWDVAGLIYFPIYWDYGAGSEGDAGGDDGAGGNWW